MTRKKLIIGGAFIITIVLGFFSARFLSKITVPGISSDNSPSSAKNPDISIYFPQPGQEINSPFQIMGTAKGLWYFEGVFPVQLMDADGNQMGQTIQARASSEWTTEDFVPFSAVLTFENPPTATGILRFMNDNPSGLPEKQKHFDVPVAFANFNMVKVQVYFSNSQRNSGGYCDKVFPSIRNIPKTEDVATGAIGELLKGPTDLEKNDGFSTGINQGVKLRRLTVENGVARADFDEALENGVSGSCRVAAIRAQIIQTLKQFPTVKSVVISINGKTADILQP